MSVDSVDKEVLLACLSLEEFSEDVVDAVQQDDGQEEETVVEIFIDHVILVVRSHPGEEEIVTVGEDSRGRLKLGWEGPHVRDVHEREVVGEATHIEVGNDGIVDLELVALELEFHGVLLGLFFEIFWVGHAKPARLGLDLVGM